MTVFIDTKINEDNFISLYMELNDGRHILSSDDQSTLFLKKPSVLKPTLFVSFSAKYIYSRIGFDGT